MQRSFGCCNISESDYSDEDACYHFDQAILKGTVHMNTMLVTIDVFVDWEYNKHPETTHKQVARSDKQGARSEKEGARSDKQGSRSGKLIRHLPELMGQLDCRIGYLARPIGRLAWLIGHLNWPIGHLRNPRLGTSAGLIGHLFFCGQKSVLSA